VDLIDPTLPKEVGFNDAPDRGTGVDVRGGLAFTANLATGLTVLDISAHSDPVELGRLPQGPGSAGIRANGGICVHGDYAHLTDERAGVLKIVDVSDPAHPVLASEVDVPGEAHRVVVSGGFAYVTCGADGLTIVDVRNPLAPAVAGVLNTIGSVRGVVVSGGVAYLTGGGVLRVVDVSRPSMPTEIGRLATQASGGVDVIGKTVFVASGRGGVRIVDVSDPAAPKAVGAFQTADSAGEVLAAGRFLYVTDSRGGLYVLKF
jgi:hypothetical protein